MTLIYRAVWDDDWCDPIGVLEDEFRGWCSQKGIDSDDIPYRGNFEQSAGLRIDIRRADAEYGKALRCVLQELDDRGRTWITTATALSDPDIRSFWVDVECDDPSGGQPELAAPRLVRQLIENGGRPCLDGTPLQTVGTDVASDGELAELLELLVDPARTFPVVVFSPRWTKATDDLGSGGRAWTRREDVAAQRLAGIAKVFVLGGVDVLGKFNSALPEWLPVYGGAVRTYLPIPSLEDPDDGFRHRWIPFRDIEQHNQRAAALLAGRLARLRVHPSIPDVWESLSGLLQRPSETEVAARAQQIADSRGFQPAVEDVESLRRENELLTKLLAEGDLMREGIERSAKKEIDRLQFDLRAAETERYDDATELE